VPDRAAVRQRFARSDYIEVPKKLTPRQEELLRDLAELAEDRGLTAPQIVLARLRNTSRQPTPPETTTKE